MSMTCQARNRIQTTRLPGVSPETSVVATSPIRPVAVRPVPTFPGSSYRPSAPSTPSIASTGGSPVNAQVPNRVLASNSPNSELAGSRPASSVPSSADPGSSSGQATMKLGPVSSGHSAQGSTTDLQEWDGCDTNSQIQGGYGGGKGDGGNDAGGKDQGANGCGKAMINPQFAAHMKKYFLKCIQEGGRAAGINGIQKVRINHMGVYVDRTTKAGSVSQHAYGRGMDIGSVDLLGSGDNAVGKLDTNVGAYSGQNQQMYDGFMKCWQESMKEGQMCGGEGSAGGLGHEQSNHPLKNADHNDHIHMSFAQCKGNPYPAGGSN